MLKGHLRGAWKDEKIRYIEIAMELQAKVGMLGPRSEMTPLLPWFWPEPPGLSLPSPGTVSHLIHPATLKALMDLPPSPFPCTHTCQLRPVREKSHTQGSQQHPTPTPTPTPLPVLMTAKSKPQAP